MDPILNDETKKYIEIDHAVLDDVAKKLPELLKPRSNPHCSCNDPYCPHKAPISPLAIMGANMMMLRGIKLKGNFEQNFDPDYYEIKKITDFQETGESVFGIYGPKNESFYGRYEIPITINSEEYKIPRYTDIIEGFIFDPLDRIESITFNLNSCERQIKLIDNKFLPKNFFFPIRSGMQHTNMILKINKIIDKPVTFKMICGNFPYINDQLLDYVCECRKMKFQYGNETFGFNIGNGTGFFDLEY